MTVDKKPIRFGHTEGHTDICFDDTGNYIVTCGSDGDVRVWEGLDDDDPKSISVGEKAYSAALKGSKLVTAASNNTIQVHTFPEGAPDGILTRFTTNANHVVFNDSGTHVAAGSSDFMIKIVDVSDSSQQKTLRGHDAPVLSIAFDPKDVYLASSSCDGSVVVWNISDQVRVTTWKLLQKSSDVSNAKSICRLSWQPCSGKLLAVPVDQAVHLYERDSWKEIGKLTDDFIKQAVNVVCWSPCGKFLAVGCVGGLLTVWNVENQECLEREKHEKGYTVCGLAWHPKGDQLGYTDTEGCLGLLEGLSAGSVTSSKLPSSREVKDYDDLFDDDDDDGVLEDHLSEKQSPSKRPFIEDDDDDDLMPSLGRSRHRGAILDDEENSLDVASVKPEMEKEAGENYKHGPVEPPGRLSYDGPLPTPRQKPFQSGSTPAHLMHRFLVWNSVGIVRGYNDEQDNAIDIEFHDTSVHHSMHLTNNLSHTLADMSQEAVLLACESTDELASKLHCLHFSSWDTNKEWMVDLPKGEDVQVVCLGQGWAAAATNAMLVRVFSIGGVQKEIFSLPGSVVCMAGHGEQLLVAFHRGTGFDGDQSLGVLLLQLGKKKRQILNGEPLPLSRKSYLAWLGFSAEGTPFTVDSEGIVRMLNRSLGNTWTPVCNTNEHCKGKSDHYWVVGIHENPQQLRCIPCKGSRYPPTLPRPAVAILPFNLPYCQVTTEKGQMEELFGRSVLFHKHLDFLEASGYEIDETAKNQAQKEQQELLMKMFALSCKLERDFRCVELAELMPHNVVTLAIRYASRTKRMSLAQRLSELALEKAAELASSCVEEEEEVEEEQEDFRTQLNAGYSRTATEWSRHQNRIQQQPSREKEQANVVEEEEEEEEGGGGEVEVDDEACMENKKSLHKLFNKAGNSTEQSPKISLMSSREGRVNPFKVSATVKPSGLSTGQTRSTNILDNMVKSAKKMAAPVSQTSDKQKSPVLKPLMPKPRSKTQATLFKVSTNKNANKSIDDKEKEVLKMETAVPSPEDTENRKPRTGFQLWLEENRNSIVMDHTDMDEADIIKEGMSRFRLLSTEDRMSWTEKAKRGRAEDPTELKKRKRTEGEEKDQVNGSQADEAPKKKKIVDASAKLSAFAFNKD
uniref:WD repeat and HMG-box DNA-binding protein 1 n=1 Tax=Erpetoichthys calabaricus TaxID=27687 RepID=A0A8C4SQK5_ERPCA